MLTAIYISLQYIRIFFFHNMVAFHTLSLIIIYRKIQKNNNNNLKRWKKVSILTPNLYRFHDQDTSMPQLHPQSQRHKLRKKNSNKD